jgi:hypothetical protein
LKEILPLPVNLCFEGTRISSEVQSVLASRAIAPGIQIPPGTIWPKPRVFHVRATEQFLSQIAGISEKHAEPEICGHFHAYSDGRGLMQWCDAFDLPLLIDESIPESKLQNFCRGLRGSIHAMAGTKRPSMIQQSQGTPMRALF